MKITYTTFYKTEATPSVWVGASDYAFATLLEMKNCKRRAPHPNQVDHITATGDNGLEIAMVSATFLDGLSRAVLETHCEQAENNSE